MKTSRLQEEIDSLKNARVPLRQTPQSQGDQVSIPIPQPPAPDYSENGPSLSRLIKWYQQDWPLKTGGLLLLLGFSWLVSYAFIQNWIGPYARVVLGFAFGALVIAFGSGWMRKNLLQGNVLVVVGIGIEFVTIWAASVRYAYFPIEFGYAIILVLVSYVAWLAVRFKSEDIAIEANVIGGLAPFLIRTPDLAFSTHVIYLMILTVGLVWLVSYKGWRKLLLSATVVVFTTSLIHVPSVSRFTGEIQMNELLFASSAFLLFYSSALIVTLAHKKLSQADLATLILNTAFITLWIFLTVPSDLYGVMSLLVTIVYATGTAGVYYYSKNKQHIFIHVSITMLMLAITALFELEGPVLTIALIFFSTVYSALTSYLLEKPKYVLYSSILSLYPLFLEIRNLILPWTDKEFFEYTLLSLAFAASYAFMTHTMYGLYKKHKDTVNLAQVALYAYASTFFILLLVWKYAHLIIENTNVARMIALLMYAVVGVLAYAYGRNTDQKYVRYYGSGLLAIVAIRLLVVETATMSLGGRIVTFIVVGLIFISSIFLDRQNKEN